MPMGARQFVGRMSAKRQAGNKRHREEQRLERQGEDLVKGTVASSALWLPGPPEQAWSEIGVT